MTVTGWFLRTCFSRAWFLLLCVFASNVCADESLTVKHFQSQSRYEFGLKLLELALDKLPKGYTIENPYTEVLNEGRGEREIISGHLDLEFISTTVGREAKMIPIKIPLYRGLLGLRLLLVKPSKAASIEAIENLEGLRRFVGGHGTHWGDLPVYAENNLKVTTNVHYENLFKMLKNERFDYFHRGVNEIWAEQERHQNDLVIANNIMLFYPHPVYFFVGKHRPELAVDLETGLKMALQDGSYKKLFDDYHREYINKANIDTRRLIVLKNPVLPPGTAAIDTSWWLPRERLMAPAR